MIRSMSATWRMTAMPRLGAPQYASEEPNEDALDRAPSLMIAIGFPGPRYAGDQQHDDDALGGNDIPQMSKRELEQRIKCSELELGTLLALRDGNRKAALEC